MTEYTATCTHDSADYLTAKECTTLIKINGYRDRAHVTDVYLSPDDARTFARGILALADGIDGGEAPEPRAPRIGDRVVIVEDDPHISTGEYIGRTGEVLAVGNVARPGLTARVKFPDGHVWWCAKVRVVDDTPTVTTPAPADEGPQVGDRVQVVRVYRDGTRGALDGMVGILKGIDEADETYPYKVSVGSDPFGEWVHEVRKVVDEPAAPERVVLTPTDLRADLLTRAATMAATWTTPVSASDVVRVAAFLAAGE